ncbi:hypothetical protein EfmAA290_26530 [Enterococcus faecium]|nr:hypothetical protein EfmAA290_26530 [Enterococcus faecium]
MSIFFFLSERMILKSLAELSLWMIVLSFFADRIVVLRDGEVIEEGSHHELLALSAILGSLQVPERIRRTEMPCNRI